jgi:putative ABC transport system substrate-binding protein
MLQHASQHALDDGARGMLDGLAEQGFVDGRTLALRRYNAENDLPTANAIAKEMVNGDYDLLLTISTLSLQSVANANRAGTVRHVFALVSDPFGAGVGISREHPLEHPRYMAGFGTMQPVAEAFALARRCFPRLTVVGEVWNAGESNAEAQTKLARATCRELGINLIEANVENSLGVKEAASSLVARGAQAIWVPGDVTVLTSVDAIVGVARDARIPVFTSIPGNTDRGALFDLGSDFHEVGRLAGVMAGQVLNGRDTATIPVENVLPQTLRVNRGALAGLHDSWSIPEDVVRSAGGNGA